MPLAFLTIAAIDLASVERKSGLNEFDLAKLKIERRCGEATGSEIIVCGRKDNQRVRPIPNADRFKEGPLLAKMNIGENATADAEVSSVAMPGGAISKRVMMNVKIGF